MGWDLKSIRDEPRQYGAHLWISADRTSFTSAIFLVLHQPGYFDIALEKKNKKKTQLSIIFNFIISQGLSHVFWHVSKFVC